jgi:hypothetical protein
MTRAPLTAAQLDELRRQARDKQVAYAGGAVEYRRVVVSAEVLTALLDMAQGREAWPTGAMFQRGQRVQKTKGSSWHGCVVGWYSTKQTTLGYCVESEREPGSVQIYPEIALKAAAPEELGREAWRPIESAPRDGSAVLIMCDIWPGTETGRAEECNGHNTYVAEWWGDEEEGAWVCYMDMPNEPTCPVDPTHWQPLPAPPVPGTTDGGGK